MVNAYESENCYDDIVAQDYLVYQLEYTKKRCLLGNWKRGLQQRRDEEDGRGDKGKLPLQEALIRP